MPDYEREHDPFVSVDTTRLGRCTLILSVVQHATKRGNQKKLDVLEIDLAEGPNFGIDLNKLAHKLYCDMGRGWSGGS